MINLLPPKEKRFLATEEKRKIILIIGLLAFVFLACLIMILISIRFYLSGQVSAEKIILEQEREEMGLPKEGDLVEEIREANRSFVKINSFYEEQFKLTDIMEKVSATIPEGVYLTIFSYQPKGGQVTVSGFADNRESLFEFKKELEVRNEFKELFFPPSVWIQAEDISFNLSFKTKLDEDKSK